MSSSPIDRSGRSVSPACLVTWPQSHAHTSINVFPHDNTVDIAVCPAAAYTTVFNCVKATLRTNGIRGPFQGLGPTLIRNAPANSVYLGSFEVMKGKMADYKSCKKTELPAPWVITAGGLGGLLYWLAIYPVDVIKSAMATDSIIPKERKYPDMVTTYKVCTHLHALQKLCPLHMRDRWHHSS